ncbi:DUF2642 domain-containing protein [Holzapfeliella sp. He02]|uniref:DUF2642 domain-containing protein n=1 Tax=Holzapfeliella saturejae TaxID=3082953 RepID=A0ABU8SG96_9LACO
MKESIERLVGQRCIISTIRQDYVGEIAEVKSDSLTLKKKNYDLFINLNYIVSVRPLPTNKKGKKKLFYTTS